MAYNQLHSLNNNARAAKIALAFRDGDQLSADDTAALQLYSGFGGIKTLLFPPTTKEDWEKQGATSDDLRQFHHVMNFHRILREHTTGEEEYQAMTESIKKSILTAFYTPPVVPASLYTVLSEVGIQPKRLYETSAGAGIFITEAATHLPSVSEVTAVEKDLLTGRVLAALNSTLGIAATTYIQGFEEAPTDDNATYDLVLSNIPFGNFSVYDPAYLDKALSGKIHNYFFVKALDKLADGGLLAFITTDGFINSSSNAKARAHVFAQADLISITVMPDNLMKDTGGTEAPSHLVILQKNTHKQKLSPREERLLQLVKQTGPFGDYYVSGYLLDHPEIFMGDEIKQGKNQYGQPVTTVWKTGDMSEIKVPLAAILKRDATAFLSVARFEACLPSVKITRHNRPAQPTTEKQPLARPLLRFTFEPIPAVTSTGATVKQIGIFDEAPAENTNHALAYLSREDKEHITPSTVRVISTIKTGERPDHDSFLVLTAMRKTDARYVYKLVSNIKEVALPGDWIDTTRLTTELRHLSEALKGYAYSYTYSGDTSLRGAVDLTSESTHLFRELLPFYKKGTLVIVNSKVGLLGDIDHETKTATFEPFTDPYRNRQFFEKYIAIRNTYHDLVAAEADGIEHAGLRGRLNESYDEFTGVFGVFNTPGNKKLILNDAALGFKMICSLEKKSRGVYIKADILHHPISNAVEIKTIEKPAEALSICLNDKGRVDIRYMSNTFGIDEEPLLKSLESFIYLNPVNNTWETADEYLSGNVVQKLATAEKASAADPDNTYFRTSLDAIRRVQPQKIPFELLSFNLGERWIPMEYYNRFATHLFNTNTKVRLLPSIDVFKVSTATQTPQITREYSVQPKSGRAMHGDTLLEHALENTAPYFTYSVGTGDSKVQYPDTEATQLAHQKIESIREAFSTWLHQLSQDDKQRIEDLYNNTYNCYVLRKYDGSHLTFPGIDMDGLKELGIEQIYPSQKNAAWRIIQNRGALIDHEMGLGKTMIAILANHEMRRLGIVKKPLLIGLKANVTDLARTYSLAFPNARILAPGKEDFTPKQREKIYHQILNNDWDCIILTHDQFLKIPQAPEIQKQILEAELDNLARDMQALLGLEGTASKRMLKGLEIRKNNLETNLKAAIFKMDNRKDSDFDFEKLGFDFIQVDEAHKFKNLGYTTRHDRVGGLGSTEGSQKALNMLFAIRTLQQRYNADLCATFLSGTPISNSLTEMYLIFKYLRPKELERQHILNFDSWAAVFAQKTTEFEFNVTGSLVAKERFRRFIKVPELALFYSQITDYQTAEMAGIHRPKLKEVLVNLRPSEEQTDYLQKLMDFARTGNPSFIDRYYSDETIRTSRMLIATDLAKKVSTDIRLISPEYSDHPANKVNACAERVAEWYHRSHHIRGTQIVFSDIGTPKPGQFNLYDALKNALVKNYQIPPGEITFIHQWSDEKRPQLYSMMNDGKIRILMGSTDKAGTGINVQKRVVAMHHLDIPWKPAELQQRNSRGHRKGNDIAGFADFDYTLYNYIYATERTLDNYKFNLLKTKQVFITQYKTCDLTVRSIDEGAFDESSGLNYTEYIAILSGDTTLLERSKVEKQVQSLENLKNAHLRDIGHSRGTLAYLESEIAKGTVTLAKYEKDLAFYHSQVQQQDAHTNPFRLTITGETSAAKIGAFLIELSQKYEAGTAVSKQLQVGSLHGFKCYVRCEPYHNFDTKEKEYLRTFFVKSRDTDIHYHFNSGKINTDDPLEAARYFQCCLGEIEHLIEKKRTHLLELEKDIPDLRKIVDKPFEKEKELIQLKEELAALDRKLTINIKEKTDNDKTNSDNKLLTSSTSATPDKTSKPSPVKKLKPAKEILPPTTAEGIRKRV